MKNLKGRTAVVTGGASGIGYALAHRLLVEGMNVVIADVETEPLEAATVALSETGPVVGHVCDVSDFASVSALADAAVAQFGGVHLLCNIAGVESGGRIEDLGPEIWNWVLSVNFTGVLNGCRAFLPLLRAQEEGHIVNMASLAGLIGAAPATAPYAVSKVSVIALSETLAAELQADDAPIGVSVVVPGSVQTRFGDAGRNRPSDVPAPPESELRTQVMANIAKRQASGALDPTTIAEATLTAIRENVLYVVTHPELTTTAVRARADAILSDAARIAALQGSQP